MYKILIDSCGEFTKEMEVNPVFEHVALQLQVGEWHQMDDDTFNQTEFLKKVAECPACPKSACPSPEKYMEYTISRWEGKNTLLSVRYSDYTPQTSES